MFHEQASIKILPENLVIMPLHTNNTDVLPNLTLL